jgi:hypothetical protein
LSLLTPRILERTLTCAIHLKLHKIRGRRFSKGNAHFLASLSKSSWHSDVGRGETQDLYLLIHLIFNWIYCEPSAEIEFSFESNGCKLTLRPMAIGASCASARIIKRLCRGLHSWAERGWPKPCASALSVLKLVVVRDFHDGRSPNRA